MSGALFDIPMPSVPESLPDARKWTERDMLDARRARYSAVNPGNGPRYLIAEHVRNQAGFGAWDLDQYRAGGKITTLRTADALVLDLWPSTGNLLHGIEVKVSRSDWLTELKDPTKAEAFRPYVDHWWLAVPDAAIVRDDLPEGWGLLAIGKDGKLRQRVKAPRIARQPMPWSMTAAWMRAVAKTANREQP